MKGIGNDNQICYIQVNEQKPSAEILHHPEKINFLGFKIRDEGFYMTNYLGKLIKFDNVMEGMFINEKSIVLKSNIVLEYDNGRKFTLYFNNDKEMLIYIKREFQGPNWRVFK